MSKDDIGEVRNGASSKEIRKARVRRLVRRLIVWVVIPTLLGIIYYGIIAAPQYDSVAVVRVQTKGEGKSKTTKVNAMLVKEYLVSRAMLESLEDGHNLKKHYQQGGDFMSNLSGDASSEDFYDFFLQKFIVVRQGDSGSLQLSMRAFSGASAQEFLQAVISKSSEMINTTDQEGHAARIKLAQDKVTNTEKELLVAQKALSAIEPAKDSEETPNVDQITSLEMARYHRNLARKNYERALAGKEKLDAVLLKEELYLGIVSPPSLPTGSVHPRRIWGILTVFVLSIVIMAVFTMLGSAIKEHARF